VIATRDATVMTRRLPLLLTQGDPAGIGPELAFTLWSERERLGLPPFAMIGSAHALGRSAAMMGFGSPIARIAAPEEAEDCFRSGLPVIDHGLDAEAEPGQPQPATAAGTIRAIEMAVRLTQMGKAAGIVTNPIAKSVLYAAGFVHPGHTEFLAALAGEPGQAAPRPVMMIWSEQLAVVPVTIHVPISAVPGLISTALIVETGVIVARELKARFGIATPRLAVAGLNPHAGEGGAMGREDDAIIAPAVAALGALGIEARGPLPADTMFHARARASYDAALTMYHDQGLIPAKTLAFDDGVNVTLGLPFVRTSPDHGTAFDIAGRGIARPDSLLAALRLARRLGDGAAP
jgi:4-hydroxythreonine-4-phosphate dehydrogenase